MTETEAPTKTNRPKGDAFRQQKLRAWQPIMTPFKVVAIFIIIGVIFVPVGFTLLGNSNDIYEKKVTYDGIDEDVSCSISVPNQARTCTLTFDIDEDVDGPLYVYYELNNFYQNHRIYVGSKDESQLQGTNVKLTALEETCQDEYKVNGTVKRNPCGLIAASFFNDVFTLQSNDSTPKGLSLNENDIAWSSDFDKFKQPDGFQKVVVTSRTTTCASVGLPSTCQFFNDSGTAYLYQYPNEDENLYLYEMYPNIISPIQGVQDEHFMVWMRTAALPSFRKLYGKIDADLKSGNQLVFTVLANFEVDTFAGTKSLVISTVNEFGGRNPYIGIAYITVGCISLLFALLFVSKQAISPRKIADSALLNWN